MSRNWYLLWRLSRIAFKGAVSQQSCFHICIWYMTRKTYIFPWNVHIGNPRLAAGRSAFVCVEIVGYP